MANIPSAVAVCTVSGTITTAVLSSDSDLIPDEVPAVGTVTFTPGAARVNLPTLKKMIVPQPVTVTLDTSGFFQTELIATDTAGAIPTDWTWTAKVNVANAQAWSFSFKAPGGSILDFAQISPVTNSSGQAVAQGPGYVNARIDANGHLVMTSTATGEDVDAGPIPATTETQIVTPTPTATATAGTSVAVSVSGDPVHPSFDFVIPKGDPGPTPSISATATQGTEVGVTRTGTDAAPVLNFTIPPGQQGPAGTTKVSGLTDLYDATRGSLLTAQSLTGSQQTEMQALINALPKPTTPTSTQFVTIDANGNTATSSGPSGGATTVDQLTDATTVGKAVAKAADAAAARTAIGAGTSNLALGTTSDTALRGDTAVITSIKMSDGSVATVVNGVATLPVSSSGGTTTTDTTLPNGVNLSGAEFGYDPAKLPGTAGTDYFVPVQADFTYLGSRGVKKVRIPFVYERTNTTTMAQWATWASTAGIETVVLDMHNYARKYSGTTLQVLGAGWSASDLASKWVSIATATGIAGNSAVEFDIMNEPHDLAATEGLWTSAQTLYTFSSGLENWKSEDGNGTIVQAASTDSSVTTGVIRLTTSSGHTTARYNDGALNAATALTGPAARARVRCTNTASGTVVAVLQVQDSSYSFTNGPNSPRIDISDGAWHNVVIPSLSGYTAADAHKGIAIQIDGPAGCVVEVDTVDTGSVSGALTGAQVWEQASQTVVTALRNAGSTHWINVESYNWATLALLSTHHPNGWWISDPTNKTRLSMHYYLVDGGGYKNTDNSEMTYAQGVAASGYSTMQAKIDADCAAAKSWLDSSSTKPAGVWIGEVGWPGGTFATSADQTSWNTAGAYFLDKIMGYGWSFTYWAAGSGYGTTYDLSPYYSTGSTAPLDTANTQAPILESRYTTTVSGASTTTDTTDYSAAIAALNS